MQRRSSAGSCRFRAWGNRRFLIVLMECKRKYTHRKTTTPRAFFNAHAKRRKEQKSTRKKGIKTLQSGEAHVLKRDCIQPLHAVPFFLLSFPSLSPFFRLPYLKRPSFYPSSPACTSTISIYASPLLNEWEATAFLPQNCVQKKRWRKGETEQKRGGAY